MTAKKNTTRYCSRHLALQCSKNFALLVENTNYVSSLSDRDAVELIKRMRRMVSD